MTYVVECVTCQGRGWVWALKNGFKVRTVCPRCGGSRAA